MTMNIVESLRSLYEKDFIDTKCKLEGLLTDALMNDLEGEDLECMSAFYQLFTWKTSYRLEVEVTPQIESDSLCGTIECSDKKALFEKLNLEGQEIDKYDEFIDFKSEGMFNALRVDSATPEVYVTGFKLR